MRVHLHRVILYTKNERNQRGHGSNLGPLVTDCPKGQQSQMVGQGRGSTTKHTHTHTYTTQTYFKPHKEHKNNSDSKMLWLDGGMEGPT